MLEGLSAAHRRYDELSAQLSQPDAATDMSRYRALMKEYKELEPLSQQYLALAAAEEALMNDQSYIDDLLAQCYQNAQAALNGSGR